MLLALVYGYVLLLCTLFVTSARTGLTEEQLAAEPGEGGTFAITGLGARGVPPTKFKADMSLLRAKLAK